MLADDFRQLSDSFNNGQRFIVVTKDGAELVSSREEASAKVGANSPAIAFSIRDLVAGVYTGEETAPPDSPFRAVGKPYDES